MSDRHIDRKAVVKLAQEAGLSVQEGNSFADDMYISVLYRFANLVASQDSDRVSLSADGPELSLTGCHVGVPKVYRRLTHVGVAWTFVEALGDQWWPSEAEAQRAAERYAADMRRRWWPEAQNVADALQHELSMIHSTIESYESPSAALRALIDWHCAVGVDPSVNGGMVLVPVSAMPAERADKHASERAALYNRGWDDCRSTVLAAAKERGNDRA